MRVLDTNYDNSKHGVFTNKLKHLQMIICKFIRHEYNMERNDKSEQLCGTDRKTKKVKWKGQVDLIFGSNSQLRASEAYVRDTKKIY